MKQLLVLCALGLLGGCGVSIDTGPSTPDEAARQSQDESSRLKTRWFEQLRTATTIDRARMLQLIVDSTGAWYLKMGERFADEWHNGELGRGTKIEPAEMQLVIERSTAAQQPLMRAYEDIAEQALSLIGEDQFAQRELVDAAQRHIERLYGTNSAVFYLKSGREEYRSIILEQRTNLEQSSREFGEVIARQ